MRIINILDSNMGKGQSKEVEEENIMVNVPVNSPDLAGDHYELHQYHGGTVKAMLIILLVLFMAIILCVVAIKRLCKALRNAANPQMTASVAYAKKAQFPDI